jgi:hypothetical protein
MQFDPSSGSFRVPLAARTVELVVLPFDPLLVDVVRFPNDDV